MTIVIFANADDKKSIDDALSTANLEYEILEPSVKNILHLAIGMSDDSEEKEKSSKKSEDEPSEPEESKKAEEPEVPEVPEEPAVEESLGLVRFNGEMVKAFSSQKTDECVAYVQNVIAGNKTTYTLNESVVSFWSDNPTDPSQIGFVETRLGGKTSSFAGTFKVRQSPTKETYVVIPAPIVAGLSSTH